MKTFKKVHVGFTKTYNPDTNNYDGLLGYIIRKPTDGWENWRNKNIEPKVITNEPRKGFKVVNVTKRSSEWFGSGRNMFRIWHPEGFQFEITANNLMEILNTDSCIDGYFQQEYALCWSGKNMALINTNTDVYKEAFKTTKKKRFNTTTAKIGQKVDLLVGSTVTPVHYLGYKYKLILDTKEHRVRTLKGYGYYSSCSVKWDKPRHYFKTEGSIISYRSVYYVGLHPEVINVEESSKGLYDEQRPYEVVLREVQNKKYSWKNEYSFEKSFYWDNGLKSNYVQTEKLKKPFAIIDDELIPLT